MNRAVPLLALAGLWAAAPALRAQPAPTPAPAAQPPAPAAAERIEITGGRETETDLRRRSTAAKIVIGRDEIDKFGDSTLGEVLRRLPGVTTPGAPGRGGPPRLRGLGGGYTQLLIDGQRVPPGFSLESLTPEQVERIEILRAPTAETGARAIAGTINIVTREGFSRRQDDVRAGVALQNGAWSPSASWTHNGSRDTLVYNLSASAFSNRQIGESSTDTVDTAPDGSVLKAQRQTAQNDDRRQGLNLTSRLQWQLSDSGDQLTVSPSLFHAESHGARDFQLVQTVPAPPALPLYDLGRGPSRGAFTHARVNTHWRQRLDSGPRLELNANAGTWRARSDWQRSEFREGQPAPLRTLQDSARTRERSGALTAKLSQTTGGDERTLAGAHSLVGGVELEAVRRDETRSGDSTGEGSGDNLQAGSQRVAVYAQDEWNLTPHWAASAGLRWEGITTRGDSVDGVRPTNRSSVATPLLHAVWKPDPKGRDQLRLSLTRSYRSPALATLIARPSINGQFPPDQANDPTAPDRIGNPALKPELATGIDIAAERYLAGGGLLSANLFHRRITNLMRSVVTRETVDYGFGEVQRYVARERNIGGATAQGIELEAKFALDQAIAGAPRVELRANLSLYRSRVDGVPGPDNRLDQQARAVGNLGADYRFRGGALKPLTLGGSLNWVPGVQTQLSDTQRTTAGSKRVVDAYALWAFDASTALRLLAGNLAPKAYDSSNTIVTDAFSETARTITPGATNWQLRLELKL